MDSFTETNYNDISNLIYLKLNELYDTSRSNTPKDTNEILTELINKDNTADNPIGGVMMDEMTNNLVGGNAVEDSEGDDNKTVINKQVLKVVNENLFEGGDTTTEIPIEDTNTDTDTGDTITDTDTGDTITDTNTEDTNTEIPIEDTNTEIPIEDNTQEVPIEDNLSSEYEEDNLSSEYEEDIEEDIEVLNNYYRQFLEHITDDTIENTNYTNMVGGNTVDTEDNIHRGNLEILTVYPYLIRR